MKTRTISEFKAHISENLRDVRGGEHYIILDRDIPVAEVSPIKEYANQIRAAKARKPYSIPSAPQIKIKGDVTDYLAQERGET